jgi:REP element-mobilizing transposase RayT
VNEQPKKPDQGATPRPFESGASIMPQSVAQVWIHLVFSTKERRPFLQQETFRTAMSRMLAYHVNEAGCTSASVGGHVDHVHLLIGLSRTTTIAKLVESIKTETSRWAKETEGGTQRFAWQAGYGAFSVSHSNRQAVDNYIRNQTEHHRVISFQDEVRELCRRHEIEIDERYMWD